MSDSENMKEAGELLAGVLGDQMTAHQQGGGFSCGEADAMAAALLLLGEFDAARTWLAGHSISDTQPDHGKPGDDDYEEGDVHYVGDNEDAEEMARSHVRYLAASHGIALTDELDVPDDLSNEAPLNSIRTAANQIQPQQHVKVWAFNDDDPWPHGRAGWEWGTVAKVWTDPDAPSNIPAVHITFTNGRKLTAVSYAVCYIVQEP